MLLKLLLNKLRKPLIIIEERLMAKQRMPQEIMYLVEVATQEVQVLTLEVQIIQVPVQVLEEQDLLEEMELQ